MEDDEELCRGVAFQLDKAGYEYDICHDGEGALYYTDRNFHDLLILDRMLPEMDGLTLLQKIHAKGIAVLVFMVTALNGLHDRIDGLDAGADDYLVKPYDMEELLARVRALLRRPRSIEALNRLKYGNLSLEKEKALLENGARRINLSKREAIFMEFLMLNHDQVLSREQILSRVWGDNYVEDGNIDNYIYFLRRRLKAVNANVRIKTIHGIGYRMEEEEPNQ